MSYLMPHQRCNHWLSGRWCAAGAQVEKGTPESCWGDVLLNPFTSQSGNHLLGEQDKSRSLPPLPGCRADPPSFPFISTCICTDALQVQEDACLAWLTLRCPLFQGQLYAVCLMGSNCLRWGRLVGAGEEGAHLSVGFRENKCKRGAPPPGRREVALWGHVGLPEVPLRERTAAELRSLWLLCCSPRSAASLQEGDWAKALFSLEAFLWPD